MSEECLICHKPLDVGYTCQIGKIGLASLLTASQKRQDGLEDVFSLQSGVLVLHKQCRKDYTRGSTIEADTKSNDDDVDASETPIQTRQSDEKIFDFEKDCVYCGNDATVRVKVAKKYRKSVSKCETLDLQESIRSQCVKRGDEWANVVLGRLDSINDLPAAEGRYHRACFTKFFGADSSYTHSGRPTTDAQSSAFQKLCAHIDTSGECQYSLSELESMFCEYLAGDSGYSSKHLKRKLEAHYANNVTVTSMPGKPCIFTFHEYTHKILHDKWYAERCDNEEDERKRVVDTAASIIRQDIRAMVYDSSVYPEPNKITCAAPDSLNSFVQKVLDPKDKKDNGAKHEAIMQSIISATRPRSFVSPLLLSVAVYVHRKYGSKELIELLHKLGFSESYLEVMRYEYSLMADPSDQFDTEGFLQYVFDNADFNIRTIDGHGTFHSMGGIQCTTPASNKHSVGVITRVLTPPKASVMGSFADVPIKPYTQPPIKALSKLTIEDLKVKTVSTVEFERLDALWISGYYLHASPRPSWAGYMQSVMQNTGTYEVSDVTALPFINSSPSDSSTIYTALCYAKAQSDKAGQKTCFVTFDQPLYIKAIEIVKSSPELAGVIVRLGGFHLLMSFMGALGHIMSGSGLQELWESVYANNSVVHMMKGHAYNRALRAHILTQEALASILFKSSDFLDDTEVSHIREMYQNILCGENCVEDAVQDPVVASLAERMKVILNDTSTKDNTAKLWVQYFSTVTLIQNFIRAERTGNWSLHLETIRKMLPFFHASGHFHYAKSAHLYHQEMCSFHDVIDKDEFEAYTEKGYFTIRRSDRFWSGVWSDMTIEQVLMRAMKVSGGLTQGRGLTDSSLAKWVCALPLCLPLCNALEEFASSHAESSEQHSDASDHKDLRPAQQARDQRDLETFIQWFDAHPPFSGLYDGELVSLSTGITGDSSVNCHNAEEVGNVLLRQTVGNNFADVKMKRKGKVKTLASMTGSIVVHQQEVTLSPQQLFNRIICLLDGSADLPSFLMYELAPRPPSLFDQMSLRRTAKAALSSLLASLVPPRAELPDDPQYVVDGGYLLQSVVWPKSATYDDVCQNYVRNIIRHYGHDAKVRLDGYGQQLSTKSVEQARRASKKTSASILIEGRMHTTASQSDFLSNAKNKGRLIKLLINHLREARIDVEQAPSDADSLIVSTALGVTDKPVVVVGTDTDLLVALVARASDDSQQYMLRPGSNNTTIFDIESIQDAVGVLKEILIFLHVVTGCDATSALYNQGKKKAYKLLKENPDLARTVSIFNNPRAAKKDLIAAGEKFLLHLYGLSDFTSLDAARYYAYMRAVAKKTGSDSFNLAVLPPTSGAAKQHIFRTYLEVQKCLGNELDPVDWGWEICRDTLVPVLTDQPPAPERLINLVSCKCKTGCSRGCGCRRAGVLCSPLCANCMGITCSNVGMDSEVNSDDDS